MDVQMGPYTITTTITTPFHAWKLRLLRNTHTTMVTKVQLEWLHVLP